MSVRAKFFCGEKTTFDPATTTYPEGTSSVVLYPVTGGTDENNKFFQSTPSGKIELHIVNPQASAQFEVGKEYFVDITAA